MSTAASERFWIAVDEVVVGSLEPSMSSHPLFVSAKSRRVTISDEQDTTRVLISRRNDGCLALVMGDPAVAVPLHRARPHEDFVGIVERVPLSADDCAG